jgi:CheY-like chemotaxis protein
MGRILVVEDDYFVAQDTCDLLKDAGFEVVAVTGRGEEAIEAARMLRPDLTLMDITLASRMDGIDAAIALREMGLPVIFTSAHTDPKTLARGAKANPLGWLSKPFDQHAMVRAVSTALASATQPNAD